MSGERLHTIELAQSSSWRSRGPTTCGWDFLLHSSEPEASLGEDPHSEVTCIFILESHMLKTHKNLQKLKRPKIFILLS
jgi:hypothetical protein